MINIKDAQEKKLQLRTKIEDAVREFENDTKCKVLAIDVRRSFKDKSSQEKQDHNATQFVGVILSVEL